MARSCVTDKPFAACNGDEVRDLPQLKRTIQTTFAPLPAQPCQENGSGPNCGLLPVPMKNVDSGT